jgi:2,4-dienoyl-CoA reductase-like NADH-dependent reductase (Old Yellow Enzyme family)
LECRRICTAFYTLKRKGVDLIDVSSGALVPYQKIPVAPNYQVPFAEQIKRKRNPNWAVGLITEAHQAEEIISSGKADLVLFARESLRNPYLALTLLEIKRRCPWPKQYER